MGFQLLRNHTISTLKTQHHERMQFIMLLVGEKGKVEYNEKPLQLKTKTHFWRFDFGVDFLYFYFQS